MPPLSLIPCCDRALAWTRLLLAPLSHIPCGRALAWTGVAFGWVLSSLSMVPLLLILLRHSSGLCAHAKRKARRPPQQRAGPKSLPPEIAPGGSGGGVAGAGGASLGNGDSVVAMENALPSPVPASPQRHASPSGAGVAVRVTPDVVRVGKGGVDPAPEGAAHQAHERV